MNDYSNKGFAMPFVLLFSFLFLALLFHQSQLYRSDQRFLAEQENLFYHHTLLQRGVIDTLFILKETDTIEERSGIFTYESGQVHYIIKRAGDNMINVNLASKTDIPGEHNVAFDYDQTKQVITDWVEGIK